MSIGGVIGVDSVGVEVTTGAIGVGGMTGVGSAVGGEGSDGCRSEEKNLNFRSYRIPPFTEVLVECPDDSAKHQVLESMLVRSRRV
jgi:hypothetical protein